VIKALPFLKDGDFVVTGAQGITEYLIRKSGRTDLLGASLRDRIRIDMIKSKHDIKDSVIGLICQMHRTDRVETPQHPPEYYWKGKIEPRLMEIEAACC
jgi:glutathione S-transferase